LPAAIVDSSVEVKPRNSCAALGDRLGARDAGGHGHPLRQAVADEAAPDAGRLQRVGEELGQRAVDVRSRVAAQQHGDVVGLEHRARRVAREADRVDECAHPAAGAVVERQVALRLARDMAAEVGEAPRDGDAEPRRPLDAPQSLLEVALRTA
jgi:hypothetical protein